MLDLCCWANKFWEQKFCLKKKQKQECGVGLMDKKTLDFFICLTICFATFCTH